jgi:hypothetical protein
MKHAWVIESGDIKKVNVFLDQHRDSPFVRQRVEWNLRNEKPLPSRDEIWLQMVACLLTTQQRSGPTSAVTRFILTKPSSSPSALRTAFGERRLRPVRDIGNLRGKDFSHRSGYNRPQGKPMRGARKPSNEDRER